MQSRLTFLSMSIDRDPFVQEPGYGPLVSLSNAQHRREGRATVYLWIRTVSNGNEGSSETVSHASKAGAELEDGLARRGVGVVPPQVETKSLMQPLLRQAEPGQRQTGAVNGAVLALFYVEPRLQPLKPRRLWDGLRGQEVQRTRPLHFAAKLALQASL